MHSHALHPPRSRPHLDRAALGALAALALGACHGTPTAEERAARADLAQVSEEYRPRAEPRELPVLTSASSLADYLAFAMQNSPRVEAAYHEWAAAVERITPARSRPDPRLVFQADIVDTVESLMPGLMQDLPGPGKLRVAGEVAAAGSRAAYFVFEGEVLRTALALKSAYYRLHFLAETLRVEQETLRLLLDNLRLAEQQNAAGRVTLQDVLRAQIERDQLETQIENLEDSRAALLAELKAALGLGARDADPPCPDGFTPSTDEPDPETLLATALARNPELGALGADVRRATAELELAHRARVPDFTLGLEVDLDASPTMFRPSAGMSLPLWRDRIAAGIAAAEAGRHAAQARLGAREIELAAELAVLLFQYREAVRSTALLREKLIPKARLSLDAARAGYVNGRASFLDVLEAQRSLLRFELAGITADTQRELVLARLSLAIAGIPPSGAPLLANEPRQAEPDRSNAPPETATTTETRP